MTFSLRAENCPPVNFNNQTLEHVSDTKYLGIHLDRRLTWKKHLWNKRKQLGLKLRNYYWLIGKKSSLSLENKLLIYKTVLKPIWTYGIQIWGSASTSNINMIERFQTKTLRMITNAPWYVPNEVILDDLKMPSVKEEILRYSQNYHKRLSVHPNPLAVRLLSSVITRRLKRHKPQDLPNRFENVKRRRLK